MSRIGSEFMEKPQETKNVHILLICSKSGPFLVSAISRWILNRFCSFLDWENEKNEFFSKIVFSDLFHVSISADFKFYTSKFLEYERILLVWLSSTEVDFPTLDGFYFFTIWKRSVRRVFIAIKLRWGVPGTLSTNHELKRSWAKNGTGFHTILRGYLINQEPTSFSNSNIH